jgi:outer membrane protein assembly factor BamB
MKSARPLANRTLVTATALLLAALPTAAWADDWPSLGLGGTRARTSNERSGSAFAGSSWRNTLPPGQDAPYTSIMASPAAADGVVVYAASGGHLRAVNEIDGRNLWERPPRSGFLSSPAIWRGTVFVADVDRTLSALSLASGTPLWTRDLQATTWASPTVVDGGLYLATGTPRPRLLRLDPRSGAVIWEVGAPVITQPLASPAVVGRYIVVGETGGLYHCFDTADGRLRWTARTGGDVTLSSPLIVGDRVFALPGGGDGQLHALQLASGLRVVDWPLALPLPPDEPDAGKLISRDHVVSSPAGAGNTLAFTWRLDDRLDTDADGLVDRYLSREVVVAVDSASRRVLWTVPSGRLDTRDAGKVPTHGISPTPAIYRTVAGDEVLAVASSLVATVRVLDLGSGTERWKGTTTGPTRSSPVLSNARLLVATEAGSLHGFLSSTNLAPLTPALGFAPKGGIDLDVGTSSLRWGAAFDPEGQPVRYEVRVDDDGELLRDWDLSLTTAPGQQAISLAGQLESGKVYHYAVRASDPQGALSAWSRLASFRAVGSPPVTVGGQQTTGLADALSRAAEGSVITLGPGTYRLAEALQLPAGVSLVGAAPHRTVLDAAGLAVGIFAADRSRLHRLTIKGAGVGVAVDARDVRLQNVILRNNLQAGLRVTAGASAELVNATVVDNGTGVRAEGEATVRNALVMRNEIGLSVSAGGELKSRFSNVQGNRTSDRDNSVADASDLALPVAFTSLAGPETDLLLERAQASTDRGDPADDFGNEPAPNGGRINIGAFGNTELAELSAEATAPAGSDPPPGTTTPAADPGAPATESDGHRGRGGGLCSLAAPGGSSPDGSLLLLLAALVWVRVRRPLPRPKL